MPNKFVVAGTFPLRVCPGPREVLLASVKNDYDSPYPAMEPQTH